MPSFFKDLRRRSRASFRTHGSSNDSTAESNSGTMPTAKSSSTLNSSWGNTTPPSSIPPSVSSPNLATKPNGTTGISQVPARSTPITSASNRYSQMFSGQVNGSQRPPLPLSQFAPKVLDLTDNSWVNQKVLLIHGKIGDPESLILDGHVAVHHHQGTFPTTHWPVHDSHFKALVHLIPGPNAIRLDFTSPKVMSNNSSTPTHVSFINVNYLPLTTGPPLQLVILLGKDSPGTFDAVPGRVQREGNGLDVAVRKFKMAAYLWQAFTSEQMFRNGFRRRCFRFEEEWQTGTLSIKDYESGEMRSEAKIHIIRSDKTVADLRDANLAQQNNNAKDAGGLYGIAMEAVQKHFQLRPGQTQHVSCLLLDSHWDREKKMITAHSALGSGHGSIRLGIFGSHALQSYPSCLEEVVPAFTDCTPTDTNFVANDCNESGSNWEAANIGIGGHLHEIGHLLGCPHQEYGIMRRDYVRLNRTFVCRESYSTRTKSPGQRLCLPRDECSWHRLDTLRFRYHPCFRVPGDAPIPADQSVAIWAVENRTLLITAPSGIAFIEIVAEGDTECHSWMDYALDDKANSLSRQITLTENDIRQQLPEDRRKNKIKIEVHSAGQGKQAVEDVGFLLSKASTVKIPGGRVGYRGQKLGFSDLKDSAPQELILESSHRQTMLLTSLKVYHGDALDGIEFCYEDGTTQLFGKRGGKTGGSEFVLDTRKGEMLFGFYVRSGVWIDGIQILTSLGRKSEFYGNATGGSGSVVPEDPLSSTHEAYSRSHTLIPPRGYSIAGVLGSCGRWLDGFSLIITR